MTLDEFNALDEHQAYQCLEQCCAANTWIHHILQARPLLTQQAILEQSHVAWHQCSEPDYLEAFTAHPKIGDVSSLQKKYANTAALASGEQHSVTEANSSVIIELAELNEQYLEKFGFIFIVCATGKSATEMLALLKQRLPNTREQELANAAAEQFKITQLRIKKLFD